MLSGAIATAFEGRQIRFHPEERTFRWLTGDRGKATVCGQGLRAAMARATLEREGYTLAAEHGRARLNVVVGDSDWTASTGASEVSGETFRALAAHVRGLAAEDDGKETES
jgi:hypothetical protein